MAITVYTHREMAHTIFQADKTRLILEASGIQFVNNPQHAILLVGSRERQISRLISKFGRTKRYLLWTHEPGYWECGGRWTTISGQRVRTLTLRSGEVFADNYYYVNIANRGSRPSPTSPVMQPPNRIICVASASKMTRQHSISIGPGDDLTRLRSEIAMKGHKRGTLDIYGQDWPRGISLGKSRDGQWILAKYDLLTGYRFNLCFENTLFPYYCSEKIWHAIYCGCLPIYFGQQTVYEDFPRNSFIDYAEIMNIESLFKMIDGMTDEDFAARYNQCLNVFNKCRSVGDASRCRAAEYTARVITRFCLPEVTSGGS
jgi:hypothetical protein